MDKGDLEMVDAEKNITASDVLVSNESSFKYENDDKTNDQSDSKGEDLKNARSEIEDQLNSKSQPEAHDNENKTRTINARTDDMVSGYLKVTDDKVQKIDERELNVHQSEKMIYEFNQKGNDIMVDRQEDHQIKTNATIVTTDGARLDEFAKVKIKFTDFLAFFQ
ncbi:hypothetical protein R3W88_022932 [Solanum pinnatisectum]|uniref:Uncharacterized protein n=1 Tax=Solanum pinnatisectum TaxID=50273 RepID=A0AAV9LY65_9SOLN|nr:hypothetical protein R3W88_022932 [Solanum pinnatisectum]